MEDTINSILQKTNLESHNLCPNIVYKSEVMADILALVLKVSRTDNTSVLITGESGTGKEIIARAIHDNSSRRNNNFIAFNSGAMSESLIESELFGHEKGSFTGATIRKTGKFELADKGTLFLDEVGELSQNAQVKLLRVLQEREFERVGGTKTIRVNVRVVTATNRSLEQDIKDRRFREDLFHRINVFPIHLPPLRERKEDIPLLIEYFREQFNKKEKYTKVIQDNVIDILSQYPWPGNIRELKNFIESLIVTSDSDIITKNDISSKYIADIQPEKTKLTIVDDGMQMIEAKSYRALCDWVIKEKNNLKDDNQYEKPLKFKAKQLGIWQTKSGFTGIGRGLINALKTHTELFRNIDKESIKNIFDLLFLLSPSFKKEKYDAVGDFLNNWPSDNNRIPVAESKFHNEANKNDLFAQLTKLVDKGEYNESNRLIDTLPDNESRLVMLKRLIEHFPNNARLLAYLAIHYGKSKQTELAIKAADLAIKISPTADEFLYYVKGRCLCLAAYDLMDEIRDHEDLTPYKMAKIKELVVQAGKQFEDCRRTETKSDHGYIVHIEMIIKALDFGYRTSGKSKISGFLMKDEAESSWYIGLLLLANNLYDELKSLHGREEGTTFINKLNKLSERLDSFTEALLMDSSQLPVLL